MNIHEYQAKKIFKKAGINVPYGLVAYTPAEAKRAAEKNEEKFVQMLNAVEWSDTALRRMLPAMEESELQIAKAYILEKIRTKETFEV